MEKIDIVIRGSMKTFWLKARAGIGNRLKALVAAVVYCGESGRCLYVDWTDSAYSDDSENVFWDCFSLHGVTTSPCPEVSGSIYPARWRSRLNEQVAKPGNALDRSTSISFSDFGRKEDIVVGWSYNDEYVFLKKQYMCDEKNVLRKFLPRYVRFADSKRTEWDLFYESACLENACAVHVRWTDKKSKVTPRDFIRLASLERERIFLCTDNVDILHLFQDELGERVVSTPKWYPPSGSRMHQNVKCDNRRQNFVEACRDIYLISRCPVFVGSDSSFTEAANAFAGNGQKYII